MKGWTYTDVLDWNDDEPVAHFGTHLECVAADGSDLTLPYDRNHDWPVGFFDLLPGQRNLCSRLADGDAGNDDRRKRDHRQP